MTYDHLLVELVNLSALAIRDEVFHVGRQPMTPAMLRRRGLAASAAHPALLAKSGATSARKVADRMADEPFRWGDACFPGRYSNGFPALYTANDFETAMAEVEYHLTKNGALANGLRPEFLVLTGDVVGPCKDLRAFPAPCQPELVLDTDYRPTQAIGAAARAETIALLRVPSARRTDGVNVPVLARSAFAPRDANRKISFFLDAKGRFRWRITPRTKSRKKRGS